MTVRTQPSAPPELCTVSGGSGSSGQAANVTVSCDTVTSVGTGIYMSCALLSHGTVACWGDNSYGELGNGALINSSVPVQVLGLFDVTQLAVGSSHACALVSSGSIYCWGNNGNAQVGTTSPQTVTHPQLVPLVPAGATATAVAAGGYHTCAILTAGGVECWGNNQYGELGGGSFGGVGSPDHTCALLSSGSVDCWGWVGFGGTGNGATTRVPTPAPVE